MTSATTAKTVYPEFVGPPSLPVMATIDLEPLRRSRGVSLTTAAVIGAIGATVGFGAGFFLGWRAL